MACCPSIQNFYGVKSSRVELAIKKSSMNGFTKEHVGCRLGGESSKGNRKEEDMELRDEMPDLQFNDLPVISQFTIF